MRRTLNKITEFITDNEMIGSILFIFIFCSRIFLDLIINKLFGLGEEWQHYIFAFYKYNYLIIFEYMFLYELCYLYRYHRFHFSKIQWIGIIYAGIAITATHAYLKEQLTYDYYTKLSLGEMMMSMVFIFDVGAKLKKERLENILAFCSWFYLGITFFINTISLIVIIFNLKENFMLWSRTIVMPGHIDTPDSLLGAYPYPGFYYNTSITGPSCSLAILLLVWLFKTRRINKRAFAALTLMNLYCLFLSSNRTGIIGLTIFFLLMMFDFVKTNIKNKRKRNYIYILSIIVITVFLCYILFKKKNVDQIVSTLLSDPFKALDLLGSARMRILQTVLKIVKQRPLLGNGWNSGIPIEESETVFPYAHNIFLGALAWTGIIGFIVFVSYFFLLIKQSSKTSHTTPATRILFFIMLSLIVEAQFENGILGDWNHAYTYLFWFIAGLLCNSDVHKEVNK